MSAPAIAAPRLTAAIHACRRQVAGLEDDQSWREFLRRHVGKESLRQMNGQELGRVLDALHGSGAPRKPGHGAGRDKLDDRPQARMARGLWIELAKAGAVRDGSERALGRFCQRATGKAALAWCTPADLNKLVEALKEWRDRVDAADPVVRLGAALEVPEGRSRDQAMVEALWLALIQAGAMTQGIHARLSTWLTRHYACTRVEFLEEAQAAAAVLRLGAWLRKQHLAQQAAERAAKRETRTC